MNIVTEETLFIFAAKHYYNPLGSDHEEFTEDIKRFKYIKKLANRCLRNDEISERMVRLILNHLIITFNVFGPEAGIEILKLKLNDNHWPIVKPFLIYLQYLKSNDLTAIKMDSNIVALLRNI